MNDFQTPAELQARLVKAHQRCQAGEITQQAYGQIERRILREIKAAHRQQYGFAMKQGAAK